ncbi:MAG: hypothetical protein ACOCXA_00735 [Planctomycetota bacterium]
MQTLCDYAGIAPPPGLPERSCKTLVDGRLAPDWSEHLVVENEYPGKPTVGARRPRPLTAARQGFAWAPYQGKGHP